MQHLIKSHISHIINIVFLGVGKPVNTRAGNNRAVRVDPELVPTAQHAGGSYEDLGGRLTHFPSFGTDPFVNRPDLAGVREQRFLDQIDVKISKANLLMEVIFHL